MSALSVRVGSVQVGVLEQFKDQKQRFSFCENYVDALLKSRLVLGQIFEDRFPNPISVDGPICWFAHLLPQGVMLKWRSKLLGIDENDTFELLQELGDDLPGAVTLTPCESELGRTKSIHLRQTSQDLETFIFRFSLAGVQWKLSAR